MKSYGIERIERSPLTKILEDYRREELLKEPTRPEAEPFDENTLVIKSETKVEFDF